MRLLISYIFCSIYLSFFAAYFVSLCVFTIRPKSYSKSKRFLGEEVTMGQPMGLGMFKAALADTPREAFNWRLVLSIVCFGLMVRLLCVVCESLPT